MSMTNILVADDNIDVTEALRILLSGEQYDVCVANTPSELLISVKNNQHDILLMDLNYSRDTTSGVEGIELIPKILSLRPELPIVVMTAWGTIQLAVESIHCGAKDFVEKPWDNNRLLSILRNQLNLSKAIKQRDQLEEQNRILRDENNEQFIANDESMKSVMELIKRIAPSDASVLITGENGTGKSQLAKVIHQLSSVSEKSMITINMGAIAETVFESEMFGHVKGAFTDARKDRIGRFELADNSSLFLDEIANIPVSQQAKLLRVLESGEFERLGSSQTRKASVRLISATNADIKNAIDKDAFRKDLFYRLNTVEIRLPSLKDRKLDIIPLAELFLRAKTRRYCREITEFDDSACKALLAYHWPGNIRELSHAIERAVLMARGDKITKSDLLLESVEQETPNSIQSMTLEQAEKSLIVSALEQAGQNVLEASEILGVSRSSLYRRLDKYGFSVGDS